MLIKLWEKELNSNLISTSWFFKNKRVTAKVWPSQWDGNWGSTWGKSELPHVEFEMYIPGWEFWQYWPTTKMSVFSSLSGGNFLQWENKEGMKLQREQQGVCGRGVGGRKGEEVEEIQTQENVKLCWYAAGIWISGQTEQHTYCFNFFSSSKWKGGKGEEKTLKEWFGERENVRQERSGEIVWRREERVWEKGRKEVEETGVMDVGKKGEERRQRVESKERRGRGGEGDGRTVHQ